MMRGGCSYGPHPFDDSLEARQDAVRLIDAGPQVQDALMEVHVPTRWRANLVSLDFGSQ
jgi:hypothetical protein